MLPPVARVTPTRSLDAKIVDPLHWMDDRLSSQAHSIEVLRTTVSQTDSLLERVLESLDSFQAYSDPNELVADSVLHRPV